MFKFRGHFHKGGQHLSSRHQSHKKIKSRGKIKRGTLYILHVLANCTVQKEGKFVLSRVHAVRSLGGPPVRLQNLQHTGKSNSIPQGGEERQTLLDSKLVNSIPGDPCALQCALCSCTSAQFHTHVCWHVLTEEDGSL